MRRFLILAMFLLGSTVVLTAQEEIVLFSDDFEDGTLDQWTLVDADCDGHNWYISEYEGNHTAYSSSMVSNPDNYLISPWLPGATRIEFKIWTDFDSDDYYEVLASFTGDQLEDFTEVVCSGIASDFGYSFHSATLPENTKYIAFRHYNSEHQRFLELDDVFVYGHQVNIINNINITGFTVPFWGEHPDYSLTVPDGALYTVDEVIWYYNNNYMAPDAIFVDATGYYYMGVSVKPTDGWYISPDATVLFNGDASINDVTFNVLLSDGTLRVFTIDFGVDPTMGVNEHSSGRLVVWPNPVAHSLFLEGVDDELVNVYDNTGRMVLQEHYNGHLNVSALPKGVYSVTVAGRTVKFVKD